MRRVSKKRAARNAEAKPILDALIARVGRCEVCPRDHRQVRSGWIRWRLDVHHIARGSHREKALDKPFAVLVVCWVCHERIHFGTGWPQARQLAILKRKRPKDYDLDAFNRLIGSGPNRITQEEVDQWQNEP